MTCVGGGGGGGREGSEGEFLSIGVCEAMLAATAATAAAAVYLYVELGDVFGGKGEEELLVYRSRTCAIVRALTMLSLSGQLSDWESVAREMRLGNSPPSKGVRLRVPCDEVR